MIAVLSGAVHDTSADGNALGVHRSPPLCHGPWPDRTRGNDPLAALAALIFGFAGTLVLIRPRLRRCREPDRILVLFRPASGP